jgi:hypothetical protein
MWAERFAELIGLPPMRYLASIRMQIASGPLSSGVSIAPVSCATQGDSRTWRCAVPSGSLVLPPKGVGSFVVNSRD